MVVVRRPYFRLVDRYEVVGGAGRLAERIAEVIPSETDFIVLDLDRTVHRDVTIGEQLGWEMVADRSGSGGGNERLTPIISLRHPLGTSCNLAKAVVRWGPAGLVYAATVRAGERWPNWGRTLTSGLGVGYVDRIQGLMRTILMMNSAGYTKESLRRLAARAWHRWKPNQVVDRDVIVAIRAHCPRLKGVVLSSASTEPTVSYAAEELGVDGYIASTVDAYEDSRGEVLSAPVGAPAWSLRRRPRFFSRPGAVVHNSAANKISFLRMQFPEIFDRGAVSIGITDNSYSEDSTWPDHFSQVVALNSRHPFSPYVRTSSPCQKLSVVDAAPAADAAAPSQPRAGLTARAYDAAQLAAAMVGFETERLEALMAAKRNARERAAEVFDESMRRAMTRLVSALTDTVMRYNEAAAASKPRLGRELHRMHARLRRLRGRLTKAGREAARIDFEIELMRRRAAGLLAIRDT